MSILTRAQINRAINDVLKANFPGVPIQSRDISKGFERPSFYVELETNRMDVSQVNIERDMTCRILFFPTSRHEYKEEVYEVQDKLEELLGLNFEVVVSNDWSLTLTSVQPGQTVVINGITFSAHEDTTTPAKREFSVSGDDAAAASELAGIINDATYGVWGVSATVEKNTIALTSVFVLIITTAETVAVTNLRYESRIVTITEAEMFIVDQVLHYNFNFLYHENIAEDDTGELMEELEYDGRG